MAEILKAAKPLSYDSFLKLIDTGEFEEVFKKFRDPVAVIDGKKLKFYLCGHRVLMRYVDAEQNLVDLINSVCTPNVDSLDLSHHFYALRKLAENHPDEYELLFREFKTQSKLDTGNLEEFVLDEEFRQIAIDYLLQKDEVSQNENLD